MDTDADPNGVWISAAKLSDVGVDEPFACSIGGVEIALFEVDGEYYATSNVCTHAQALLTDGLTEGRIVECPLHNGRFDVCSGKALTSPVEVDLQTYRVRISGSELEVFLPKSSSND